MDRVNSHHQYVMVDCYLLTIAYVYKSPREELDTVLVQKALINKGVLIGDMNLQRESRRNKNTNREMGSLEVVEVTIAGPTFQSKAVPYPILALLYQHKSGCGHSKTERN